MLPQTIKITAPIRDLIISKRHEKKLTGIELSKSINQTNSYISALENSRIKNLPSNTLVKIFSILFDIDATKAESQIEDLISNRIRFETPSKDTDNISTESVLQETEFNHYKVFEDNTNNTKIENLIHLFDKVFHFLQEKDPKAVDILLKAFPRNIKFDLGFMIAIWEAPFFGFEALNHEERQKFLIEFAELFKRYALMSKSKEASNETEESSDDESEATPSDQT